MRTYPIHAFEQRAHLLRAESFLDSREHFDMENIWQKRLISTKQSDCPFKKNCFHENERTKHGCQ